MITKSFKFVVVIMLAQFFSYYLAGIVAQAFLGAKEFYPPSQSALVYLKDPHIVKLQLMILPAQLFRGLIFGLILLPLYPQIIKLGRWKGSFLIGGIVLCIGYLAASGGLIEHMVYFKPEFYPMKFALITLIEIVFQTIILSLLTAIILRKEFKAI
jgi:hypothetical protein